MLTTLQQAKKLKELGYTGDVYDGHHFYYFGREEYIFGNLDQTGSFDESIMNHSSFVFAPSISEALDWLREEKGIMCYVDIVFKPTTQKAYYIGKILSPSGLIIWRKTSYSDSHSLAESALLDEVMKYVECCQITKSRKIS